MINLPVSLAYDSSLPDVENDGDAGGFGWLLLLWLGAALGGGEREREVGDVEMDDAAKPKAAADIVMSRILRMSFSVREGDRRSTKNV